MDQYNSGPFDTMDLAKQDAENKLGHGEWNFHYHTYVYENEGKFYLYWHTEDRYVTSYIPFRSQILWHGTVTYDQSGQNRSLVWEKRGNHTQYEFDVIAKHIGTPKAEALKDMGVIDMDIVGLDDTDQTR